MKIITVKYRDAVRPLKKKTERTDIKKSIKNRLFTDSYAAYLRLAAQSARSERSKESYAFLFSTVSKTLLGSYLSEKMFHQVLMTGERFFYSIPDKKIEYSPGSYLYHITPAFNIKMIKKQGLVSKDKKVYLTDDPEYILYFAHIKASKFKKNLKMCIIKVDAEALAKKQKLYYKYSNVYYTGNISPEYLIWE